jgi:hypothetical protein
MFAFLLSVGILVTVAGCFTVGFGIPNNGFDLGNTLIVAGTTSICAGLVLIGLAACVRELRRISDALPARLDARPVRGLETPAEAPPAASPHPAQSPRMPYPAKAVPEGTPREPRPPQPRLGAAAPEPAPIEEPERTRPNIFPISRPAGEHPIVEEPEAAPLAPMRPPAAAPLGRTPASPGEPPYEPKFGPADILARLGGPGRTRTDTARPIPASERAAERPAERAPDRLAEPPSEHAPEPPSPPSPARPRGPLFDAVWPSAGKPPGRFPGPDTIPRVAKPEVPPEPRNEPREPRNEPRERVEPPTSSEPREVAPPPRPAPEARTGSILKSGVIDGMAYTLYTDGSIEAQLPHGTVRFSSIDDLRDHLEKHD